MTNHNESPSSDSSSDENNNPKAIYLLPSLFTTAGLFFGFYAVILSTQGRFADAASALLIAMITDGLDGRVARWTNTASNFGKEYDSLVDLICFGLAPAIVMYFWSLHFLGKAGWLAAFFYLACTAIRLARFNTLTIKDNRYFYGLPCPSAAAFVVFCVWCFVDSGVDGARFSMLSAFVVVFSGFLMVSNIKFRSFKDFDAKNKISFVVLLAIVLVFILIVTDPPLVLFLAAFGYALSGPCSWLWRWHKGHATTPSFLPDEDDSEIDNDASFRAKSQQTTDAASNAQPNVDEQSDQVKK